MSRQERGRMSGRRLVGLDGLRAFAVLLVLGYHFFPSFAPAGRAGVDVFFVISGFLITALLLGERTRTGRINLRAFWQRRMRRLFPALLLTVVGACALAFLIGGDALLEIRRQVVSSLLFFSNWSDVLAGSSYFDHAQPHLLTNTWSLSVEAQFYLLWPSILGASLWCLGVRGAAQGSAGREGEVACLALWRRLILTFVALTLATLSFALAIVMDRQGVDSSRVYLGTDTHAFGLMGGAALALLHGRALASVEEGRARGLYAAWLWVRGCAGWLALVLIIVVASGYRFPGFGHFTVNQSVQPLALVSGLTGVVLQALLPEVVAVFGPGRLLSRLLDVRPFVWVGERSYGIYLWHWPLMVLAFYAWPTASTWQVAAVVIPLSLIVAACSYRWVETSIRTVGLRAWITPYFSLPWMRRLAVTVPTVLLGVGSLWALVFQPSMSEAEAAIRAGQEALDKGNTSASPIQTDKGAISGRMVTFIGDSVTVASAGVFQEMIPGVAVDAKIGRSIRDAPQVLDTLDAKFGRRPYVVVALSHNDTISSEQVDELVKHMGKGRRLVLVTAHGPESKEFITIANRAIHEYALAHPDFVRIADWEQVAAANIDLLSPDRTHPRGREASALYAQCIIDALAAFDTKK